MASLRLHKLAHRASRLIVAVYEVGYDRRAVSVRAACAQDTMAGVVTADHGISVPRARVVGRHAHVPNWCKSMLRRQRTDMSL